jgi:hypothetical protein
MRAAISILAMTILFGCSSNVPLSEEPEAQVKIGTGGAMSGTTIYAIGSDDRLRIAEPAADGKQKFRERSLPKGTYDNARSIVQTWLRAHPTPSAAKFCHDYGADWISIDPPINGRSGVEVECPDADVIGLMNDILELAGVD